MYGEIELLLFLKYIGIGHLKTELLPHSLNFENIMKKKSIFYYMSKCALEKYCGYSAINLAVSTDLHVKCPFTKSKIKKSTVLYMVLGSE